MSSNEAPVHRDIARSPCIDFKRIVKFRCQICDLRFDTEDEYWEHTRYCTEEAIPLAESMVGRWVVYRTDRGTILGKVLDTVNRNRLWLFGAKAVRLEGGGMHLDIDQTYSAYPQEVEVLESEEEAKAVWDGMIVVYSEENRKAFLDNIRYMEEDDDE